MTGPTFQDLGDLVLEVLELEGGEEAERAQVEGHDRRHGALEQQAGVQQRAVPAQADDEVDLVRQLVLAITEGLQLVRQVLGDQRSLRLHSAAMHGGRSQRLAAGG